MPPAPGAAGMNAFDAAGAFMPGASGRIFVGH